MKEIPFYFSNGEADLFGLFYEPAAPRRDEAFIFVDAFAEEKLWTQRVMVSFARLLASRGHAVMRFDFMGHGDSDGSFAEATVASRLADIEAAAAALRQRAGSVERISLLGLRLGATLAFLAAPRFSDIGRVILWAPIVDGGKYMKELLRANLVTQTAVYKEIRFTREQLIEQMKQGEAVNVEGYAIRQAFYEQAAAIDLLQAQPLSADGLVVQIDKKVQSFKPDLLKLCESQPSFTLLGAEEEPFWKEINTYYGSAPRLYDVTLGWLEGGQ